MLKYINRDLETVVNSALEAGYIVAILGARQTGKTTMLNSLKDEYIAKYKLSKQQILFLNLDDPLLRSNLKSNPNLLLDTIKKSAPSYVFIDEAQKAPEIFDSVKILHDQRKQLKIILTGSSSLDIQQKSAESLAGRILYYYLYPLSVKEILFNKFNLKSSKSKSLLFGLTKTDLNINKLNKQQSYIYGSYKRENEFQALLNDLLLIGSLPGVWKNKKNKDLVYKSMVETFLDKDIRSLKEVGSLADFSHLLQTFAFETGSLLNIRSLSRSTGISINTLKKYYSIMLSSFVLNKLSPLVSVRKQFVKSPKTYYFDVGIANYLTHSDRIEHLKGSGIIGSLFENLLIKSFESYNSNLTRPQRISFWRDHNGHEIDLVLQKGKSYIPIEITFAKSLSNKKRRNFTHFFKHFPSAKFGLVVYTGELSEEKIEGKKIYLIPWWMWW